MPVAWQRLNGRCVASSVLGARQTSGILLIGLETVCCSAAWTTERPSRRHRFANVTGANFDGDDEVGQVILTEGDPEFVVSRIMKPDNAGEIAGAVVQGDLQIA